MGTISKIVKPLARLVLAVEEHGIQEVTEQRMAVCRACPNFDPADTQCGVCGCYLEIKTTLLVNRNMRGKNEVTHCPLGQWGDLHPGIVDRLKQKGVELSEWTDRAVGQMYQQHQQG